MSDVRSRIREAVATVPERPVLGRVIILASLLLAITQVLVADEHKIGSFSRAKFTTHPAWFKESFLDFEQDIAEATAQGKRLVLYFYQGFVYIKL